VEEDRKAASAVFVDCLLFLRLMIREDSIFVSSCRTRKTIETTVKTIAIPQAIKCAWTNIISCVNSIKIGCNNKIPKTEGK
jgi:hypothetical protein